MFSDKKSDWSGVVVRIGFGMSMLLGHGLGKLQAFSQIAPNFPDPLGVGSTASLGLVVFAELVCAAFIVVGLFSRMMSIPLVVTMAIAFFQIHALDPWNKKEVAFLYLIGFFSVFMLGSGRFSLQGILKIGSNSRFPILTWLLK